MTTLEDVHLLIERGYYEEALEKISELRDPLEVMEALRATATHMLQHNGPVEWIPDIIDDMLYLAKKSKEPSIKAPGYAMVASTLALIGEDSDAADLFDRALKEAKRIKDPLEKGNVMSRIAYELAVAGYTDEALEVFNTAFDSIITAEVAYTHKVDGILNIGDLMEMAGDVLPADRAVKFYRMAFDIFDKLHVNQKAAVVEKKIDLATTVRNVGLPSIRSALLEGRNHYALALMEKMYRGIPLLIGKLEVALWLKRINNPEYLDIMESALEEHGDIHYTETNVQHISRLLTELGNIEKALEFARRIDDPLGRSEAMKAIALELTRMERFAEANEIIKLIDDPAVREEAIKEMAGIKEDLEVFP